MSAVRPRESLASILAPRLNSSLTASTRPLDAAAARGVRPSRSARSTSHFLPSSASIELILFMPAAVCRALAPKLSTAKMSAPRPKRSRIISGEPLEAAA